MPVDDVKVETSNVLVGRPEVNSCSLQAAGRCCLPARQARPVPLSFCSPGTKISARRNFSLVFPCFHTSTAIPPTTTTLQHRDAQRLSPVMTLSNVVDTND